MPSRKKYFLMDSLGHLYKQMKEIEVEHSVEKAAREKPTVETGSLKTQTEIKTAAGETNREKGKGPDFLWMDGRKGGRGEGRKKKCKAQTHVLASRRE